MESEPKKTYVRNWKNWLILILAIAVTLLWFFRSPAPPQDKEIETHVKAYQDTATFWKAQAAKEKAAKESAMRGLQERVQKVTIDLKRQEAQTKRAIARAVEAEKRIPPAELTQSVKEALAAKDSVNNLLQAENDSLRGAFYDFGKELTAYQEAAVNADKIQERMQRDCEASRVFLQNEIAERDKKLKKVPFLKKAVTWLGVAVLIETGILALK